jgi:phage terminase large subunit
MKVKLHDGQLDVATDNHRFRIICAGRRWGKSTLAQLIVLKWATQKPGLYWIVSPSYRQAKQIHWRSFQQIVPREWIAKVNQQELSLTLKNGSIIELKGAENPDALRGVKLRGIVIDEIASIRSWNWLWSEVLRPTLTDYEAPAIFISTPKGFNHFYELYTLGQQGRDIDNDDQSPSIPASDYKSWRFTSYDNPYIPHAEIDKARQELTEDTFQQEYMADFRKFTGLVYKEFDRAVHVRELPDFRPVYYLRGLDRGFRNPTALPVVAVDADGTWYQTDELYQAGLTNPDAVALIKQLCDGHEFEMSTMDSANASDIGDFNDLGLDFIPVKKVSGEANVSYVRWKIQKFAERLKVGPDGRAGYYVHPRCTHTLQEFEAYAYPDYLEGAIKNPDENPMKINDHMMDALADLNGMYLHDYQEPKRHPWDGKIPGTFIRPSMPDEDENEWTQGRVESTWEDAL